MKAVNVYLHLYFLGFKNVAFDKLLIWAGFNNFYNSFHDFFKGFEKLFCISIISFGVTITKKIYIPLKEKCPPNLSKLVVFIR